MHVLHKKKIDLHVQFCYMYLLLEGIVNMGIKTI